ncbi:MAG: hypothetical protein WAX38_01530 [Minisyncoccia bacterium]
MQKYFRNLWIIPAVYVSYFFSEKLLEVIADPTEFVDIISVLTPLAPVAQYLAYGVGIFDVCVGIALLVIPSVPYTKQYSTYIFSWVICWPLVPASLRYFGGVAEFEIVEVAIVMSAGVVAWALYRVWR